MKEEEKEQKIKTLFLLIERKKFQEAREYIEFDDQERQYILIHATDTQGNTLLHKLAKQNVYYEHGVQVTKTSKLAQQNTEIKDFMTYLIEEGLNINLQNKHNQSPIMLAIEEANNPIMLSVLLKKHANIEYTDNKGQTILHLLLGQQTNTYEMLMTLFQYHLCHDLLTQTDKFGQIPLAIICTKRFENQSIQRKVVSALLEKINNLKNPLKMKNDFHEHPLHSLVALNIESKAIETVLKSDKLAINNLDLRGYTPLLLALEYFSQSVDVLLNIEKTFDKKSYIEKEKPLLENRLKLIELLLTHGADPITYRAESQSNLATNAKTTIERLNTTISQFLEKYKKSKNKQLTDRKNALKKLFTSINKIFERITSEEKNKDFLLSQQAKLKHIEDRFYAFKHAYKQAKSDPQLAPYHNDYDKFFEKFNPLYDCLTQATNTPITYDTKFVEKAVETSKQALCTSNEHQKRLREMRSNQGSLLAAYQNQPELSLNNQDLQNMLKLLIEGLKTEEEAMQRHLNFYKELMQRAYDVCSIGYLKVIANEKAFQKPKKSKFKVDNKSSLFSYKQSTYLKQMLCTTPNGTIFTRQPEIPDPKASYSLLDLTQLAAKNLLKANLEKITPILIQEIEAILLKKTFINTLNTAKFDAVVVQYHTYQNAITNDDGKSGEYLQALKNFAKDEEIVSAYVDYATGSTKVNDGYPTPAILLAIGASKDQAIRLWSTPNQQTELVLHISNPVAKTEDLETVTNVLINDKNHPQLLENMSINNNNNNNIIMST